MKFHYRVFAAMLLAAALSLPSVTLAASQQRDRARETGPIVRTVQKIRKFFGITTHEEFPTPPVGNPSTPKP
jgi:hypothetical protein